MNIKQATAGLRTLFHALADGAIHQIYDKDKARYVAPIPDGTGNQLVAEGSYWRKGNWQVYLQTPIGGGGRVIQDLFTAQNSNVVQKIDAYIEDRGSNSDLDTSYIQNIRIGMRARLCAPVPSPREVALQP